MKTWQRRMIAILKKLADEEGADLVEYVLLISFIAFGATAGAMPVAQSIGAIFDKTSTQLASAVGASSGGSSSSSGGEGGSGDGSGYGGDH